MKLGGLPSLMHQACINPFSGYRKCGVPSLMCGVPTRHALTHSVAIEGVGYPPGMH